MTREIVVEEKKLYTYEDVVQWAGSVVEKVGESFVYTTPPDVDFCVYAHHVYGEDVSVGGLVPGCMIGHMLSDNTVVTLEELDAFRKLSASGIRSIAPYLPFDFTPRAMHFLKILQERQDNGWTWGEALTEATDMAVLDFDRNEEKIPYYVREYGRETDPFS